MSVRSLDAVTAAEVEKDAEALARIAGYGPRDVPNVRDICTRLTGFAPMFVDMTTIDAVKATIDGHDRLFVRSGTPPRRARWLALHELGEWHYGRLGESNRPDTEERCNLFASALVAPRLVYRGLEKKHGTHHRRIANELETTESCAFLRRADVLGHPAMLVRNGYPIVRGRPFAWPELRVEGATPVRIKGVSVAKMRDAPHVGLRAG